MHIQTLGSSMRQVRFTRPSGSCWRPSAEELYYPGERTEREGNGVCDGDPSGRGHRRIGKATRRVGRLCCRFTTKTQQRWGETRGGPKK